MREIKFRVWSPYKEMMSYDVTLYANGWITCVHDDGDESKYGSQNVVPLMQYTGLKDKNGKEIYEEDLWLPTGCETVRIVRKYKNGYWFHHPRTGNPTRLIEWAEDGEVIGNVYSNPELLEVSP